MNLSVWRYFSKFYSSYYQLLFLSIVLSTAQAFVLLPIVLLKTSFPNRFRRLEFRTRTGEIKVCWGFSQVVRRKRYGKERILIVPEEEDLSDKPRFLVTNALHWEAKRILNSWSYRWPCEIFHEFTKQGVGFEAAPVRKPEAVKRGFQLSCVAQTLLQDITLPVSTSRRFDFAKGRITQGQRQRKIIREVLLGVLTFAYQAFSAGQSQLPVLDRLLLA